MLQIGLQRQIRKTGSGKWYETKILNCSQQNLIKWISRSFKPIAILYIKCFIFIYLPSTNFQTFFFASYFLIFSIPKIRVQKPDAPLQTFPNFGPPTFGFWFQSAHEIPTRLKMSGGWFKSTLNVFFKIKK